MEEKFELLQFVRIVKERKTSIFLGVLISLLIAKFVTDYTPPVYQTSMQMLVTQGQANSKNEPLAESYQAILLSQQLTTTFSNMLTSRTLAERVDAKLGLSVPPELLQRSVNAEAIKDTQLIKLTVTTTDPDLASKLANAYANEFIKMTSEVLPSTALINVKVIDWAAKPYAPISPKPLMNLIGALLLGLVLSTGFAFVLGILDVTVKDKEDLEQLVSLPSLAQVPNVKQPLLFSNHDSVTSEVYRTLRTNLQYINFDQSIKTLIVSSPGVNEGKTTVASNLAIVIAQAGYKVLLIDSDLRSPRLGQLFGAPADNGLSSVLVGMAEVKSVTQSTNIDGLYFIASGPTPPNPADLFDSEHMDSLLETLEQSFDFVIIDCPPILAVADTPILAVKADAVLLIANFRKTKKSEMVAAKDALNKVGARIIGFVITGTEMIGGGKFNYYYRKPRNEQKAA